LKFKGEAPLKKLKQLSLSLDHDSSEFVRGLRLDETKTNMVEDNDSNEKCMEMIACGEFLKKQKRFQCSIFSKSSQGILCP